MIAIALTVEDGSVDLASFFQPHIASHGYVWSRDVREGITEDVHQFGKREVGHEGENNDHM